MRAKWTSIYGNEIVIENIKVIEEVPNDRLMFHAKDLSYMKLIVDNNELMETDILSESCRVIDSQIVLSADKE